MCANSARYSPDTARIRRQSAWLAPLTIIFHAAPVRAPLCATEEAVTRPRAADDFPAIRARMEELERERAGTTSDEDTLRRDAPLPYAANGRSGTPDRSGLLS